MNPASGGPCQGIRNSIPVLEKLGIYREVVCLDDPSSDYLGKDAFVIHALGPGFTSWSYGEKLLPWLISNIQRFDVVVINGLWQYSGYAVRKALQHVRSQHNHTGALNTVPKCFVMPHGMLDPYFQKAAHRKLKAIRNWFYWKLIERKTINNAEGVLFTCEEELLLARTTFTPYHPKKEVNVGYGIAAPPLYDPLMKEAFLKRCPQVNGKRYFLFLSRIHDKKGVNLLLDGFDKITEDKAFGNDHSEMRLVIGGPGLDTGYGKEMQRIVFRSSRLKDRVYFPGMLTGNEKWGAFYGCEAFILPSHQENFGIAVVEAMACNKAVLISDQINIWREIEGDGAGIVAKDSKEGTIELFEKWFQLSSEEKLLMEMNAGLCFEKNFSIELAAMKFLNALLETPALKGA